MAPGLKARSSSRHRNWSLDERVHQRSWRGWPSCCLSKRCGCMWRPYRAAIAAGWPVFAIRLSGARWRCSTNARRNDGRSLIWRVRRAHRGRPLPTGLRTSLGSRRCATSRGSACEPRRSSYASARHRLPAWRPMSATSQRRRSAARSSASSASPLPRGGACERRRSYQRARALVFPEGLCPSDSPTRSLARRFAGALRSRGSLAGSLALLKPSPRFMR